MVSQGLSFFSGFLDFFFKLIPEGVEGRVFCPFVFFRGIFEFFFL